MRAVVQRIVIEPLPEARPDGQPWDRLSAADPWLFVYSQRGEPLQRSGPFQDLPASQYPIQLPAAFSLAQGEPFRVELYEQDNIDHDIVGRWDVLLPPPGLPGLPQTMTLVDWVQRPVVTILYTWSN